jgi:hypothetical protein
MKLSGVAAIAAAKEVERGGGHGVKQRRNDTTVTVIKKSVIFMRCDWNKSSEKALSICHVLMNILILHAEANKESPGRSYWFTFTNIVEFKILFNMLFHLMLT